ncbi:MAG: hypothetical protein JSW06_09720, partial [Thermoplasmatales archaeon]
NSNGILLFNNANNNTLIGNKIIGYNGIDIYSTGNIISSNFIGYVNYGILIRRNNNTISENTILECDFGIKINSHSNIIKNNNIHENAEGIYLSSRDNTIQGNIITYNSIGIEIVASDNIIKLNRVAINRIGFLIEQVSDNIITKNNIYLNYFMTAHFSYTGPRHDNDWISNYWGRPRFLPKIIRGVTGIPFRQGYLMIIPVFDFDFSPAKEPYDISSPEVYS